MFRLENICKSVSNYDHKENRSILDFVEELGQKLFIILLFISKEEIKAFHTWQNHKILEYLKLEGIHVKSNSSTLAGLLNTKLDN